MKHLGLRTRIFLFFCLIVAGSLGVTLIALWIGYRQLGMPDALSSFVTTGLVIGFGLTVLVAGIWLLFDDNVAKPIESIAASLRVRAHVRLSTPIDVSRGQYLGDLAPAASALGAVLDDISQARSAEIEGRLAELEQQRDQLVEILSDIPIATILATADHRIVLYDGQAAGLMEDVGMARLKTSVFDYLEETAILDALSRLNDADAPRRHITVTDLRGTVYSGHIRVFGTNAGYTLMLEPLKPSAPRPLTYDFDLLASARTSSLKGTPLRDLIYVVFDFETTGLDPARDEVVQLGAVRIVNGKVVDGEVFEALVKPPIAIPQRSTDVHGIDNAMVADAASFAEICARFHDFASGSVLVAHNAAFDMAFLHRQAPDLKLAFDHPVVDTVLMSAVVFGGTAVHTLDAICDRLGITIPADRRHTAMGDAIATAHALAAMIQILDGRGIATYGALRTAMDKHRRILQG